MDYPNIAVIVAALNEEKYISQCIESILSQNYAGKIEIIVADGGSNDRTKAIVQEYKIKNNNITLLENEKKIQSVGRNIGLRFTNTRLAVYLDAHSYADENWLNTLYDTFIELKKHDFKIAGISSIYKVANPGKFTNASNAALSKLLSGATKNVFQNKTEISKVDNGYAILYDIEVLKQTGFYNESLKSGEDIELNHRITKIFGYNLYVNPKAITYYHRPENFFSFAKQQFKYGLYRLSVMKLLNITSYKALVPSMFLLCMLVLFIFGFFSHSFHLVLIMLSILYLLILFFYSLFIGIKEKINPLLLLSIFLVLHISYGSGMIIGLFKGVISR